MLRIYEFEFLLLEVEMHRLLVWSTTKTFKSDWRVHLMIRLLNLRS